MCLKRAPDYYTICARHNRLAKGRIEVFENNRNRHIERNRIMRTIDVQHVRIYIKWRRTYNPRGAAASPFFRWLVVGGLLGTRMN